MSLLKATLLVALLSLGLIVPSASFLPVPLTEPGASPSALHVALNQQLVTDLVIAGTLGFVSDPLVQLIYNGTHPSAKDSDFRATFVYSLVDSISVAARVFGGILLLDLAINHVLYLNIPIQADLRSVAPQVGLTVWAALTACAVKRTIFLQAVSGNRLGRVSVYDKLLDFVIGLITVALVLDEFSIDLGMGLQSVLTGSGIGAIVFSLASKDLAQQIVGGFVIQAWDAFEVGDSIRLGDGTEGTVTKIGLVETEIVGSDNISIKIPNSQLTSQRVSNLSSIHRSQVKQLLRFKYSDLDKLPLVLNDIKDEIKTSCPKLISNDSKPFQAVLTQYQADHIQAVVNCHFDIPPESGEYTDTRQEVLLAIARALKTNNVTFALPSIFYQTSDSSKLL